LILEPDKPPFIFNRDPLRPGSVAEALHDTVEKQYAHLGFGIRHHTKLPKYEVRGINWKGKGINGTDIVWMWVPQTRAAMVVKAVESKRDK